MKRRHKHKPAGPSAMLVVNEERVARIQFCRCGAQCMSVIYFDWSGVKPGRWFKPRRSR